VPVVFLVQEVQKMCDQERQVHNPLAQRWYVDAQDGQTVIQIRAERASLYSHF
jgi:hypothetical protein